MLNVVAAVAAGCICRRALCGSAAVHKAAVAAHCEPVAVLHPESAEFFFGVNESAESQSSLPQD